MSEVGHTQRHHGYATVRAVLDSRRKNACSWVSPALTSGKCRPQAPRPAKSSASLSRSYPADFNVSVPGLGVRVQSRSASFRAARLDDDYNELARVMMRIRPTVADVRRMTLSAIIALGVALPMPCFGQDVPERCTGTVAPFDSTTREQLVSAALTASNYFMNSPDVGLPHTYEGRRDTLNKVLRSQLQKHVDLRTAAFRAVQCHYHGIDWNQPGGRSSKTMTAQAGFYFLQETADYTRNGDMKRGPTFTRNTVSWTTGGHHRSSTYVDVDARYEPSFISNTVQAEIAIVRHALAERGVPTEWN